MRTTVDIDPSVLEDAKRLARQRGKTLGETISVLVAGGLAGLEERDAERPRFEWPSQPLHAVIDLEDKDAVWAAFDEPE